MSIFPSISVRAGFAALSFVSLAAQASLVVTSTNDVNTLTNALVQPGSGITILSKNLISGQATQQGTYTGFNLAPSSGTSPTLSIANGVVLSSGRANVGASNSSNNTSVDTGNGAYAALTNLAETVTNNANVLEYTFSLSAGLNAISLDFLFGSEEFPTQSVTDIFGVFVDGVNYARFQNGKLIGNNDSSNFISNPVGGGLYASEYNGLTQKLSLTGLTNSGLSTHTLTIGIADTTDTIFDSGVYVANLRGIDSNAGGINPVPEPGSLALVGISLACLALARRKAKA